jgi:hypothetical protein
MNITRSIAHPAHGRGDVSIDSLIRPRWLSEAWTARDHLKIGFVTMPPVLITATVALWLSL